MPAAAKRVHTVEQPEVDRGRRLGHYAGAAGFDLFRSRWARVSIVLLLWREHGRRVSRQTVRRWLRRHKLVWRPRPVVGPEDPNRAWAQHELGFDFCRCLASSGREASRSAFSQALFRREVQLQ